MYIRPLHGYKSGSGFYSRRYGRARRRWWRRWEEEQIIIRNRKKKGLLRASGTQPSALDLVPAGPQGVIGPTGERAFPEVFGFPLDVIGQFVGELIHTYNATWEWTGFVWRQRF